MLLAVQQRHSAQACSASSQLVPFPHLLTQSCHLAPRNLRLGLCKQPRLALKLVLLPQLRLFELQSGHLGGIAWRRLQVQDRV
jgi:hypothetical protein